MNNLRTFDIESIHLSKQTYRVLINEGVHENHISHTSGEYLLPSSHRFDNTIHVNIDILS